MPEDDYEKNCLYAESILKQLKEEVRKAKRNTLEERLSNPFNIKKEGVMSQVHNLLEGYNWAKLILPERKNFRHKISKRYLTDVYCENLENLMQALDFPEEKRRKVFDDLGKLSDRLKYPGEKQ